jgi:hypothetical protein
LSDGSPTPGGVPAVQARFAALAGAFAGSPGVSPGSGRRGFGADALQVGGHIFAMVSGGRLVLKLPSDRVAELLASGDGLAFDAGKGRPMKEWVSLRSGSEREWRSLAQEAFAFVAGQAGSRPAGPAT